MHRNVEALTTADADLLSGDLGRVQVVEAYGGGGVFEVLLRLGQHPPPSHWEEEEVAVLQREVRLPVPRHCLPREPYRLNYASFLFTIAILLYVRSKQSAKKGCVQNKTPIDLHCLLHLLYYI